MRFPDFTDEWKKVTLGEIGIGFNYGLNAPAKEYDGMNKYIRITDIEESTGAYSEADIVSPNGKLSDEYIVNNNDILLARTGASTGKSYLYAPKDGRLYFAGFLIRFNVNKANPYFIYTNLHTRNYWRWVNIMSARSGQPGINSQEYSSYPLYIPSRKEQNKIANLLQLLDERIATQNKIIDNLQSLIKGLAKTHYDFCKTLSSVKIRELGEPYSVMNLSKEQLSDNGQPCILYGELFTLYGPVIESICSKTNIELKLSLSSGKDLLFPSSTTVNALSLIAPSALTKPNIILGGDMFGIKVANEYSPEYLSYYFNYIGKHELAKYAIGSTIIHLHYKDIAEHTIAIPSLIDQLSFVKLASTMKSKIENEKFVLHNLKTLKAYLLQAMFI